MFTYKIEKTLYTNVRPSQPIGIFRITVENQLDEDRKIVSSFCSEDLVTKNCTFEQHLSACEKAVNTYDSY